jgi:hypothetical protein
LRTRRRHQSSSKSSGLTRNKPEGLRKRAFSASLRDQTAQPPRYRKAGAARPVGACEPGTKPNRHAANGIESRNWPCNRFRPEPATHQRATRARRGAQGERTFVAGPPLARPLDLRGEPHRDRPQDRPRRRALPDGHVTDHKRFPARRVACSDETFVQRAEAESVAEFDLGRGDTRRACGARETPSPTPIGCAHDVPPSPPSGSSAISSQSRTKKRH